MRSLGIAALVLAALPASAQDATPPRLHAPPAPAWPAGEAPREVEVVLVVDVDETGRVANVTVERGVSPAFDAAAIAAARALTFDAARSGETPIASRVRMPIRFVAPPPPPPSILRGRVVDARTKTPVRARVEAVGRSRSVVADADGRFSLELDPGEVDVRIEAEGYRGLGAHETLAEGEVLEVRYALAPVASAEYETIVTAPEREEISRQTLRREEVTQTPGTMGDPFRVIETLPGVTPIITGLPYYYIRGAPPADTGYFFAGVRVPALFHLALGPSVIHPYLVDRVDFWAGGAPARYPGFVGGIVSADMAALPRDRPRLDLDVRLIDAGAITIVPFNEGRTRASVSGRYSYTAALLSAVSPGAVLDYWDYQVLVEHDLAPNRTASVFAFGSYDYTGEEQPDGSVETGFSQEFHRLVVSHRWRLSRGRSLDVGVAGGYEQVSLGQDFHVGELTLGPRARWTMTVGRDASLSLGADGTWAHSDLSNATIDEEDPEASDQFLDDPDVVEAGVYAEMEIRPQPKLTFLPGMRLSGVFYSDVLPAVDPRFGFRYSLTDDVVLKGGIGLYHQKPAFLIPLPGLDAADLDRGLQRSIQASQGVEWTIPEILGVDAQLFYHRYENLSDVDFLSDEDTPPRMEGNAYGLEVIVRRPIGERFFGWIAYTLSRNDREYGTRHGRDNCPFEFARDEQSIPGQTAPSEVDRTHVVNLVASYLWGWDIRTGARLQYRSGHAFTVARCLLGEIPVYGERNGARTPGYFQLDLRVDKRWRFDAWSFELYFDMINATFAADTLAQLQYPMRDGSRSEPTLDFAIPIVIPTLGFRGVF